MVSSPAHDPSLSSQLDNAREEAGRPLSREDVAAIIAEVVGSMEGDFSAADLRIYRELEALAGYIQAARKEIAAIRPDEIRQDHIPAATDELDAVVSATEDATGRILDAAEQVQTIAGKLEQPVRDELIALVTSIFEASNFQDVTGQRISKVVRTLKHIEGKIDALVAALGTEFRSSELADDAGPAKPEPTGERELLNGPQLPGNAIDQDEIDRLLAGND